MMMHSNDFVICIIVDGVAQQESKGGIVSIPFGTEYKIRLRNKHNRRAVAKVFVDEENVSKGGVIVQANDYVDLDGPVDSKRNFKFVSSESPQAVDAGKNNQPDDRNGIIRVDWQLEREYRQPEKVYIDRPVPVPRPWYDYGPTWGILRTSDMGGNARGMSAGYNAGTARGFAATEEKTSSKILEEGCTVEGSRSNQSFTTRYVDLEDSITTLRITLKGYAVEHQTVISKGRRMHCSGCGGRNKSSAKFCVNCGSKLSVAGV
jgi:hypothetical protein